MRLNDLSPTANDERGCRPGWGVKTGSLGSPQREARHPSRDASADMGSDQGARIPALFGRAPVDMRPARYLTLNQPVIGRRSMQ
jgi:hypothetical protein